MSSTSRLDRELLERFVLEAPLPAPSGLHRRRLARPLHQPAAPPLLITCAHHLPLPLESVARQQAFATLMQTSSSPLLTVVREFKFEPEYHWMMAAMPPGQDLRTLLCVQQRLAVEQVEWLLVVWPSLLAEAASWLGTEVACPGCARTGIVRRVVGLDAWREEDTS